MEGGVLVCWFNGCGELIVAQSLPGTFVVVDPDIVDL